MKNIIEILKEHGITKSRFAIDFCLSRPTLDEYIEQYQSGKTISKEKYQIIFDSLFNEQLEDKLFVTTYFKLKHLIRRDKTLNMSDLEAYLTDDIMRIVEKLKEDAKTENKFLIYFFSFILANYEANDSITQNIILYANYLNRDVGMRLNDTQKKYLGSFYHLNSVFKKNPALLDIHFFDDLQKRKRDIEVEKKIKSKEVERQINHVINQYVSEAISNSSREEDVDTIVNRVLERLKN